MGMQVPVEVYSVPLVKLVGVVWEVGCQLCVVTSSVNLLTGRTCGDSVS